MFKLMTTLIALTAIGVGVRAKSHKLYKDLEDVKYDVSVLDQKVAGVEGLLDN